MTHEEWIRAHVEVTGEIDQPYDAPWSTVLRVPGRDGVVWFKENIAPLRHEAAVLRLLAARCPDRVTELVAVDVERGWMLTRDAGTCFYELHAGESDWLALLPRYAELQLAVAADADALVAAGAPDRRLAVLPGALASLLDAERGLAAGELARLRAFVPRVAAACEELASFGIPESIQHDDLHGANVFARDGVARVVDWGDACVSHPFGTLTITLSLFREDTDWDVDRLRDAYLEPFGPPATLPRAADLGELVGAVTRALKWAPIAAAIPRPHRWEDAVAIRLRVLVDEF